MPRLRQEGRQLVAQADGVIPCGWLAANRLERRFLRREYNAALFGGYPYGYGGYYGGPAFYPSYYGSYGYDPYFPAGPDPRFLPGLGGGGFLPGFGGGFYLFNGPRLSVRFYPFGR